MASSRPKILLIDPERAFAPAFRAALEPAGFSVIEVRSAATALDLAGRSPPNIAIKPHLDSPPEGASLMERLRACCADIQFIFVSPRKDVQMAMAAIRRGAFDCLPLPCEPDLLLESVRRALEHQRLVAAHPEILARLDADRNPDILVGESDAMRRVKEIISRVADADVTVLIEGESGTGKELVARLLHERGMRRRGPFVAVNCAALADGILESELFGHVKGAFTGAVADKPGRFALAAGGTLFLDEIGDLSPKGQADLLRVLEDGIYRPLGSTRTATASARVVAATNRDLGALCREGRFREDLLYRLNVIVIPLEPLRNRPSDIPRLAEMFLRHFCSRHRRPLKRLSPDLIALMQRLRWPGNVRQLRNAIERMTLLVPSNILLPEHLPSHLTAPATGPADEPHGQPTLAEAGAALIRRAIERAGGNKTEAARMLGISRRALHYRLAAARRRGG